MKRKILVLLALLAPLAFAFSQSPVAHWGFNNHANDSSANSINGTLINAPFYTTVRKEGSHAIELNGIDEYVDFGNPQSLPSDSSARTISAWAKTDTLSGYHFILSYGYQANAKNMHIGQNGAKLVGGAFSSDLTVSDFWQIGVWHHICLTYDGTTGKLYADGALVASGIKTWTLQLAKVYVGRQLNNREYWNGTIDDVRIFNTELTAAEVQALVTPPPSTPTSLSAASTSLDSINLTWNDVSINETGFQIERSLASGSGYSLVNTTAANVTSFTDSGLNSGTRYYYRLRAVNPGGVSAYTSEANAKTTTLPIAPTGLTSSATSTSMNLAWSDQSSDETGFHLERSLSSGSGFQLVATTSANAVAHSDINLYIAS